MEVTLLIFRFAFVKVVQRNHCFKNSSKVNRPYLNIQKFRGGVNERVSDVVDSPKPYHKQL
jgi:hypothetical protein